MSPSSAHVIGWPRAHRCHRSSAVSRLELLAGAAVGRPLFEDAHEAAQVREWVWRPGLLLPEQLRQALEISEGEQVEPSNRFISFWSG